MIAAARRAGSDGQYPVGDGHPPLRRRRLRHVLFSYNGIDELNPEARRYEALREIRRVLAPSGRFVFSTHNILRMLLPYPFTPEELRVLADFWWRNFTAELLRPRQANTKRLAGERRYHIDPRRQASQLDVVGFDFVALLGRGSLRSKYFGPTSYFVAQRPH